MSDQLTRDDVKNWEKPVQDLLLHLANKEEVRYRMPDADHILLYPPDGVGRPFKCSRSRPAVPQVRYINNQFMKVYGVAGPDGTVPGAELEAPEAASPEVDQTPTAGVPDAQAAILALAQTLGVELGGGVAEEDYLAVIAEKDQCQAEVLALTTEIGLARESIEVYQSTIDDLTKQRDELLQVCKQVEVLVADRS